VINEDQPDSTQDIVKRFVKGEMSCSLKHFKVKLGLGTFA